jgi:hypothetical protein
MPTYEYRNGQMVELPDVVITESGDLHDDVKRTVIVESGVELTTHGKISGTVNVRPDGTLIARGGVGGTVNVSTGARATFHGNLGGTLNVDRGGAAILASSASALGAMNIIGTLDNYGTRGKEVRGSGRVTDHDGSTVREPDETWADGTTVYYG